MEGEEGIVCPHTPVCEDTLPSSFLLVFTVSLNMFSLILEAAGTLMTNIAILSQDTYTARKNKKHEHVTETLADVNKKQLPPFQRSSHFPGKQ